MIPANAASQERPERVLVLVRGARDAELTRDFLVRAGFEALVCSDVADLAAEIEQGAGAALVEEEILSDQDALAPLAPLAATLSRQPPWSDFPVVVFSTLGGSSGRDAGELARVLGNVTFLDRPVRARSMLASVHAAIRGRRRQYEARRAIEARDTFLAMLGHELRNPLGAIHLALGVLENRTGTGDGQRELGVIGRQSRHLTRLVGDLLDVARITQGKLVLERERLDLTEVARSAFEAQESRARDRGLTYELRVPPDAVWVDGDRQRLEQVFANLITNAIKYTRRGGSVTLSVAAEGDDAVVTATDTGVGIAPEMIGRLFEPFVQADRTLDRTEGGIGLGLALVRSLVELHGGTAEGTSPGPNRGSAFVVRLPNAKCAAAPPPGAEGATSTVHLSGRRIVVVEDSADIRELLVELLAQEGHDVSCAEDGPGGLAALLQAAPDIAFIDLGLPGFDGLELARRARASGVRTALVAVTGYGQPEDRRQAFNAGFDEHLTKPVVDADLQRVMKRLETAPSAAGG